MKQEKFYTVKESVDIFRLNIMTIYRYIKVGRLKTYK